MIAQKVATFQRVLSARGVSGVTSVLGGYARAAYHRVRAPIERGYRAASHTPAVLSTRRAHPAPRLVLAYYGGIGDDLLLTALLRELRRRDYRGVWVTTQRPELFAHRDDADLVLPWNWEYEPWVRALGWNYLRPRYTRYLPDEDRDIEPSRHIIAVMCQQAGVVGEVALRPYLTLTDAERAGGARVERQVVVQSAGISKVQAMRTKQWYPERFQQVVDLLRDRYNFVQVGMPSDPALEGAVDLRGQTNVRETAAILSQSLTFVSQVGMLMHLGRAVDRRGVIVYGGRETPAQSGYSGHENLYSPVPCSPCWRQQTCPFDVMCMQQITAEDVAAAIERQVARHGEPLPVDTDVLGVDPDEIRWGADGRPYRTILDLTPFEGPGRPRAMELKFLPGESPRATAGSAASTVPAGRSRTPDR